MEPVTLTPQDQAAINKKMTLMETKDIAMFAFFVLLTT